MLLKIYVAAWALIAVAALAVLATGNFTMVTLVEFGFVCFGMVFMGMMGVLPSSYAHHEPAPRKAVAAGSESGVFHAKHLATR